MSEWEQLRRQGTLPGGLVDPCRHVASVVRRQPAARTGRPNLVVTRRVPPADAGGRPESKWTPASRGDGA